MELKNKQEEKDVRGVTGLLWGTVCGGVPGDARRVGRAPACPTHGPKPAHSAATVTSWACARGMRGHGDDRVLHTAVFFPSSSSSSAA